MKTTLVKKEGVIQKHSEAKIGASMAPPTYGLSFIDAKPVQKKANNTGLPDQLKSGVESLSGIDMSDVKVHYNSSQPAQLNAHAYAQGNQIHVAPGQEKHLPHEAWHVVQQKQGRVKATKQFKGKVNINDDRGLEKEADVMGGKAIQMLSSESESSLTSGSPILSKYSPIQRVLIVNNVPIHPRDGGKWVHRTFDDSIKFKNYLNEQIPSVKPDWNRFWNTPLMGNYIALINQAPPPKTIEWSQVKADIIEATTDAERLDTLDPDGPVPDHHEFLTFAEAPDDSLRGHSKGPVGYASKMMGKKGGADDFAKMLSGVSKVILTTGTLDDIPKANWVKETIIGRAEAGGDRRPGLSIINYSNSIYRNRTTLAVCGVRGKILMDQFGLAIRVYGQAILGKNIQIQTIFNLSGVLENYSRLRDFFKSNREFQNAHTIIFGYASAFEKPELKLLEKKEHHGWVGYLFKQDQKYFAVFDSDLTHSYHGEILAQNVKLLLEDPVGSKVTNVIIGGSAGSLVMPKSGQVGQQEDSLAPNGLYIPDAILRPDGRFKENSLSNIEISNFKNLATIPGSMHTSVVSVLAETPGVLRDLLNYGVKTVDMEFAYVALVLGNSLKPTSGQRDLADVRLGVACLVTDFPKTGAHGIELATKDPKAKKATKDLFVNAVIASMK